MIQPHNIDRESAWGSCKTCNSERPASPCWKCGGEVRPVAPGWEWPGLNDIGRIRELAREVGYAVGVHGSMQRDQDLIAVPWVADAVSPLALAQHIAKGLGGEVVDYETQDKPCGRWSCNIRTPVWTKLIDLSVMPPVPSVAPTEAEAALSSRPVDDTGGEFSGVNLEATAWRENVRRALDLALMVAEDLSKGYRDSDEEDDFMRCPACKGWIDHYGHTPTCDLVVLEKRAREGLQALAVIPTNLDGEVS